jgi:hypothetical protein
MEIPREPKFFNEASSAFMLEWLEHLFCFRQAQWSYGREEKLYE